jgi:hypothetical protein
MKMTVFCVVALHSRVKLTDISEVLTASIITDRPDDGGSNHLRNVRRLLPDYTAQQSKGQLCSMLRLFHLIQQSLQLKHCR